MIRVETHSLVGTPSEKLWSQAQGGMEGRVGIILSLAKTEEEGMLDLASLGGAFLQKMQSEWSNELGGVGWLMQLKDEIAELGRSGARVEVLGYQCSGDKLMLWGVGAVEAYLIREGAIAKLGDGTSLCEGVEGVLMSNDVVVLASEAAVQTIGVSTLGELINDDGVFEDNLAPLIYRGEETAGRVMQVLKLEATEILDEAVPVRQKWVMPSLRIQRMSEEPKKFNLIVGATIIVALIFLVLVGIVSRSKKQASIMFEQAKSTSANMVEEARGVAETNPERAKILISQASETLKAYINSEPKQNYLDLASAELAKIESSEKEILRVRGIELTTAVELELVASGLKSQKFESDTDGNIYFWDQAAKNIVGFNLADASSTKYEVKDVGAMGAMAIANNGFFGVVEGGIWQGGKSEQKVVIERDELWGKIGQIGFFGSNVYLLDLGNGEIWKYSAVENGYSERKRWFGAGIVLDLSKIVDWVVDGDIWLLSSSGKLERYSRGVPAKFELIGFPAISENGTMLNPSAVTISEDKVYVLENGANRVVSFDINGKYEEQYVSTDFARASDLMVHEGRGYVLIENVVKEWEL